MKIDRSKLNTLLRSGLNPDIKTRKHLAACLELDSTSLTRWFSNRDRLGNPRFPVVPDRHVTKILQLFEIDPECLNLDGEAFRQYCFALSMQRAENNEEVDPKESSSREEKIAQYKLTIPQRPHNKSTWVALGSASIVMVGCLIWWMEFYVFATESQQLVQAGVAKQDDCWTGYSESLGEFSDPDESDPCHYNKLLRNALTQLEQSNNTEQTASVDDNGTAISDYMIFLSRNLDARRVDEKIRLNVELGRSELNRFQYAPALEYFNVASRELSSQAEADHQHFNDLATYTALAVYADKPWRYARESLEQFLMEDPTWKNHWLDSTVSTDTAENSRQLAISELENGNLQQAKALIESSIESDALNLPDRHLLLASNWSILSRILGLQGDYETAKTYALKAMELNGTIFGPQHPRVIQDQIVLTLLLLKENNIAEAHQLYLPISEFFQSYIANNHPAAEMNQWFMTGIEQLSLLPTTTDNESAHQKEAWSNLRKAFNRDNPFIPRRFAVVLLNSER